MIAFGRTHSHRGLLSVAALAAACCLAGRADAQVVVYRPVVPMFAPAAGPYVANYTPAGNYAAVTAYSPPVFETVGMPVAPAPVVAAAPVSPVAVTSYYAPAAAPAYIEPTYSAPVATTAYYAPATTAYYAPATTAYYAPATTAYYAPAAVAVPLYRRGLFGAYRPVRAAYYPYY